MSGMDGNLLPSASSGPALPDPAAPALGDAAPVNRPGLDDPSGLIVAASVPANNDRLTIPGRSFMPRVAAATGGLRVLPLQAFAWSGPSAQPRSRGDHVLIWRPADSVGIAGLRLPGRAEGVGPGTLRWLPAGIAFALVPAAGVEGLVMVIARDAAARSPAPLPGEPLACTLAADDAATLGHALGALALLGPGEEVAAACHLGLIGVVLARCAPAPAPSAAPGPVRPNAPQRALVQRFTDLAENEIGRGRTLADLAAALGSTTAEVDRACRMVRSCSALDLVHALQRSRAIALLRETRLPPARIAEQVGFASLAHMTRMLSLATGRSPDALRRGL